MPRSPRLQSPSLRPVCGFGLFIVLLALRTATAATPSHGASIEAEAARADIVVIGTVKAAAPAASPSSWRTVTISVLETLKGNPSSEMIVRASIGSHDPPWLSGRRSVFFIQTGARSARWDPVAATFPWVLDQSNGDGAIDLTIPASHGILSADLRNGLPPERLLALIRPHCGFGVKNASELIASPLGYSDGWPCLLELPIDPATDETARQWARSPDATTRWNATRVLRHTNSPANIAAVQLISNGPPDSSKARLAQAMATDGLRRWSVAAAADNESTPMPRSLRHGIGLLIAAGFVAALYFVIRRNRDPRLSTAALVRRTAAVAAILTLATCCAGSYFEGAGFSNGRCEIALSRGKLLLIRRSHLEIRSNDPGRFVDVADLWAVQDYFQFGYERGVLPWSIVGGMQGGGQEVEPYWTTLFGFVIPLWEILAFVVSAWLVIRLIAAIRRFRRNRLRGFAVVVPSGAPTPTSSPTA